MTLLKVCNNDSMYHTFQDGESFQNVVCFVLDVTMSKIFDKASLSVPFQQQSRYVKLLNKSVVIFNQQ